jgi:chromate transporter
LFFGYHVLKPQGFSGRFDGPSALIAVAVAVALLRFKRGVIQVLTAYELAGMVIHLLQEN